MYPARLRRLPGFSYTGKHRYSLTFRTHEGRLLFNDAALVEIVRSQLLRAGRERGFEIHVYCFMPDHFHVLVRGITDDAELTEFVKHAKQLMGYHGKQYEGLKIWQSGYYDRLLDDDEDARAVVAYILMNPVRAGLVAQPEEYPFSGSGLCELSGLLEQVRRYL